VGTDGRGLALWSAVWLLIFVLDMVFIKWVIEKTRSSGWDAALMQNAFAAVFLALVWFVEAQREAVAPVEWTVGSTVIVLSTCIVGTLLSYTGMSLRSKMSATTFAVVGIVCKMVSILLNEVWIGEDNNNVMRLMCVIVCIACSSLYRQSPLRAVVLTGREPVARAVAP